MTKDYGQYCGLARALEIVGARWTLLILRDLMVGPKRFSELQEGLHGIPTNILSSRLRELEDGGIVQRTLLSRPPGAVAYELTRYGHELEDPLIRLGMWGAKSLGPPTPDHFFNTAALSIALQGRFHPEKAQGLKAIFELRLNGPPLYVSVEQGEASFATESNSSPDATLECHAEVLAELLAGYTSVDEAIASERLQVTGSRRTAKRFFEIFQLPSPERVNT
jgi:DNA-binding HxlR family transcriptional regulator/putative sterol carrier protein